MATLGNGKQLDRSHEGSYIRFDGFNKRLESYPPRKTDCYRLHHVWGDGINIRKHGTPIHIKPSFVPTHKLNQRVEVFTVDEFEKLPE
jgi:hypothetical protein